MIPSVRRYHLGDRPNLIEAINTVCAEGKWMSTHKYKPTPGWEHSLESPECACHLLLVAVADSQIVGWCRTFPRADAAGSASLGIGLLAGFRDQGTGTQMVNQSLEWALQAKLNEISLTTRSDNERAIHVFQRCGFETTDDCHNMLEMRVQLSRKDYAS